MNTTRALPVSEASGLAIRIASAVGQQVLGKPEQIRLAVACLLAGGHLLIEDLPGVGKTTLARTLAEVCGLAWHRLQFTSDMLPADLVGVSVWEAHEARFAFRPGPVFAELVLAETSLWAESGGQDSDQGVIIGDGFEAEVLDVQKPVPGLIVHTVKVNIGTVAVDARAETHVDADYRRGATQAHSGTHIVHAALREVLGPNAHQAGSYNKAGYLRLDFTHSEALSTETKSEIEEISNLAVRSDYEVVTREMSLDDAKALGAMALFGEKYGDRVRMVEIGGPWSRELCAGTHVSSSAEVGMINLIGESSVGSTNRRIESLVGIEAFRNFAVERTIVQQLSSGLKVPRLELVERVSDLSAQLKAAEKKIAQLEAAKLGERMPALLAGAEQIGALKVVLASLGTVGSADDVRGLVQQLRDRLSAEAAVVVLAGDAGGKPVVIAATTQTARDAGAKAGALAKLGAQVLGGGGGGKDDLAQGGGADPAKIDDALAEIRRSLVG